MYGRCIQVELGSVLAASPYWFSWWAWPYLVHWAMIGVPRRAVALSHHAGPPIELAFYFDGVQLNVFSPMLKLCLLAKPNRLGALVRQTKEMRNLLHDLFYSNHPKPNMRPAT